MSFLGKLLGIGVAAAGAAAVLKVAQKYTENKAAQEAQPQDEGEPSTLQDMKEDIVEAAEDAVQDVKEQAEEVADVTRSKVKDAAVRAGIDTDELAGSFSEAGKALMGAGRAVVNAGASVAQKVAADAPEMLEKVKAGADTFLSQAKDALASVNGEEPEEEEDATHSSQPDDEPDEKL